MMLPAFMAVETFATEYYIAPTGSDTRGNGSMGKPWATMSKAHDNMLAGDTLNCRGGTYKKKQSTRSWTLSGRKGMPVTIQAYPGEIPFFDGSAITNIFLRIRDADYITVDGLKVRGYKHAIWVGYSGFVRNYATNNTFKNNYFYDQSSHCIYVSAGTSDLQFYNNVFEDPGGHHLGAARNGAEWCIQFWHGPGVNGAEIYNNIFLDGSGGGVVLGDGATDVNIYNNTFYGNDKGIKTMKGQDGSERGVIRFTAKNNIFYVLNSNSSGFSLSYSSQNVREITLDHNLWYRPNRNGYINWNGSTYNLSEYQTETNNGNNSIEADPDFVKPGLTGAKSDFHLKFGSPAIDTGIRSGAPSTDCDGVKRPRGGGYDIGSFEGQSTSSKQTQTTLSFDYVIFGPNKTSVKRGSSVSIPITAQVVSGSETAKIRYQVQGLPAWTKAKFSPNSCFPNCAITLTINTSRRTKLGTYTIIVKGSGGGITRSIAFKLIVRKKKS